MQIEIFDVGHGQCAVATAPNGRRIMLDCGTRWSDDSFWTPSLHYFGETIELLALLNLDEDHIGDFGSMLKNCTVPWILSNPSIGANEFRALKTAGMGTGAKAVAQWMAGPKGGRGIASPDFGEVQVRYYWNTYARDWGTNDLSLVVVLQFGLFKIMFAGDLENKGWHGMLQNADFRRDLLGTKIFVASHHGRESGCCEELFNYFRPEIVIISDDDKQHKSQETNGWYRQRCSGAPLIGNPFERRYVMTTRRDGSMRVTAQANGVWQLHPFVTNDWPTSPPAPKKSPWDQMGAAPNPFGTSTLADILRVASPTPKNALSDLSWLDNPLHPNSDQSRTPLAPKTSPWDALSGSSNPFGANTLADVLRAVSPPPRNALSALSWLDNPLDPNTELNSLLRYLNPR